MDQQRRRDRTKDQRKMLAECQAEYQALAASDLAYTMLQPPTPTDGPATGTWTLTQDTPASKSVARADVAAAMVAILSRDNLMGKAPFLAAQRKR